MKLILLPLLKKGFKSDWMVLNNLPNCFLRNVVTILVCARIKKICMSVCVILYIRTCMTYNDTSVLMSSQESAPLPSPASFLLFIRDSWLWNVQKRSRLLRFFFMFCVLEITHNNNTLCLKISCLVFLQKCQFYNDFLNISFAFFHGSYCRFGYI